MNTESCFTTVLWMALLLGYLQVQAHPITKPQPASCSTKISFDLLRKDVSCGENVTFVTTNNVLDCEANALKTIINELTKTKNQNILCKDDSSRINQTMEELTKLQKTCPLVADSNLQSDPSKCEWGSGSFKDFLNSFEVFLKQLRNSE